MLPGVNSAKGLAAVSEKHRCLMEQMPSPVNICERRNEVR